jgi:hypothetical protein
MKQKAKLILFLAVLLSLATSAFAQFNKALPENNQSPSSFSVPKHSLGIDLFPIVHNLFAGKMRAYTTVDFNSVIPNSRVLDYYSSHKPIGFFYNLRLGRERQDVNTFLTFGIQGLYGINQYDRLHVFFPRDTLWHGYKATNSQIGFSLGTRRDWMLSKHWGLSLGGELFYGRNSLVLDTAGMIFYQFAFVTEYERYINRTVQTIFGGAANMGLVFHLSEQFLVETRLSVAPQYIQTSFSRDYIRRITHYTDTGEIDDYNPSEIRTTPVSSYSFAFNSRINIVLFYKF